MYLPRYLASSGSFITVPFMVTWGHVRFFISVKVTCTDLVSFTFIQYCVNHFCTLLTFSCNICETIFGFLCTVAISVSSAKVAVKVLGVVE